jgi:glutathione S-transferase
MEVYGTQTSPFTRIVRMVAMESGIDLPLREIFWRKTPDTLFEINPGGRIPLLVDGPRRLGESRAICNYLMEHERARPVDSFRPLSGSWRWEEEHLLGIIYAAIESMVVIRVLGDPPAASHPYLDRCRERIACCFGAIDGIAGQGYLIDPDRFGMAEAALITAADVIEGRGAGDLGMHANVGAIRRRFSARPSVAATVPVYQ